MRRFWILPIVVLAACTQEKVVGIRHEPPVVSLQSPTTGAEFARGEAILFEALVTTLDNTDLTDLTHEWRTSNQVMCASDQVPADGLPRCEFTFDDLGTENVTIKIVDPQLDSAEDTIEIEIVVNEPPTITILSPANDAIYGTDELIVLEALVNDEEDLADELVVTVTSSLQGQLSLQGTPTSDGTFQASAYLQHGLHLLTFRVEDEAEQSAQDSVSIGVNTEPTAPGVQIIPDPAKSGDGLQATITADSVDIDGDIVSYTYDWYYDNQLFSSGTNPTVPSAITHRDEFWEVRVTPHDTFGIGAVGTASLVISNSAPSIQSVTVVPTQPDTDEDLIGIAAGWSDQDNDFEKYKFQWFLNGAADLTEVTASFPHSKTQRGDELQLQVTPYDDYDQGNPVLSPTIIIVNGPPSKPVIQISPPVPGDDNDLQCQIMIASTDPDGDIVQYEYAWYQNGLLTQFVTSKIEDTETEIGDTWECRVTPYDGDYGPAGSATVAISDIIAPDAPDIDDIDPYRNEDEVALSGTCEPLCDITLYCEDSTQSWSESAVCDAVGEFTHDLDLTAGEQTDCYAVCEDSQGNLSGNSNTVVTEACAVKDQWEDGTGYGDLPQDAIDLWGLLPDDGTTVISIEANILEDLDEDWYIIETTDDLNADIAAAIDYYRFHVNMANGSNAYGMIVHRDGFDTSDIECGNKAASGGYTEYTDYAEDVGTTDRAAPVDSRQCGAPDANDCTDFGAVYYIQIIRDDSQPLSCEGYELTITNGYWP
jgi:hypothetical protein